MELCKLNIIGNTFLFAKVKNRRYEFSRKFTSVALGLVDKYFNAV